MDTYTDAVDEVGGGLEAVRGAGQARGRDPRHQALQLRVTVGPANKGLG